MRRVYYFLNAPLFALVAIFISLNEAQAATFRILIVYTQAAQDNLMSVGKAKLYGESIANQIYENSATSLYEMPRVELAGVFKVNYTITQSLTALEDLRRSSDVYMNEVHTLRNLYAADVVALVHKFTDAGGRGYLDASSGYAFQVTDVSSMITRKTLSHENGHIFGCGHNWEESISDAYIFGHGYIGKLPGATWGDNMAYVSPEYRQRWYSNPNEWHEGERRGTFRWFAYHPSMTVELPSANCSFVHHGRKGTIAGFRNPPAYLDFSGQTIKTGEFAHPTAGTVHVGSISNTTVMQYGSEGVFKAANAVDLKYFFTAGKLAIEAPSVSLAGTFYEGSVTTVVAPVQVVLRNENGENTTVYGTLDIEAPSIHNVGFSKSVYLASGSETNLTASSSTVLHPPMYSDGKLTATGITVVVASEIELAQNSESRINASHSVTIGHAILDGYLEATAPTVEFDATSLGSNSNTKLHALNPIALSQGLRLAAGGKLHLKVGGSLPPLAKVALESPGTTPQGVADPRPIAAAQSVFASRLVHEKGRTMLEYSLPEGSDVSIRIVDVRGKTAAAHHFGRKGGGKHFYVLPESLSKGSVYMIQLRAGGKSYTHRFVKAF